MALNFSENCRSSLVVDYRINLLDDIEVGFIVCVTNLHGSMIRESFLNCKFLTPDLLQGMAERVKVLGNVSLKFVFPVTVFAIDLRMLGGLMSSFRMFDSVARGNPLSSISSRSSYMIT